MPEKLKTVNHEKNNAEEALRRGNELLRGIFESIQDGMAVVDMHMNIIMVNRAVEKLFRHEGGIDFKTKKCYEVYCQAVEPCDDCEALRAIQEKTAQVKILPFKTEGDGAGWLEIFNFPLYDEHGAVKGVIQYLRDITEKRMLAERAMRNDHLAALGQISAGIAHEINNPNNIIMGNAELLKDVWHDADSVLSEYHAQQGDFHLGGLPFSEMRLKVVGMLNRILDGAVRIDAIVKNHNGTLDYKSSPGQGTVATVRLPAARD